MDKAEVNLLKTAILNEIEGEKFYRKAALEAQNQESSKAFLYLAEDEKRHQAMLREMLTELMASSDLKAGKINLQGTPSPEIFKNARIMNTDRAMEISVFHIAIMIEKASIDYYRRAAETTTLPAAKELYESLADWEVGHLDSMEKIYDDLTNDWWDKQSYSPS